MPGDEEPRTATFDHKRSYGEVSPGGSSKSTSTKSAPRKRAKRVNNSNIQHMKDSVPDGGSFTLSRFSVGQEQDADVLSISNGSQHYLDIEKLHSLQGHSPLTQGQGHNLDTKTGPTTAGSAQHSSLTGSPNIPRAKGLFKIPSLQDINPGASVGRKVRLPVKENRKYSKFTYSESLPDFLRALTRLEEARKRLATARGNSVKAEDARKVIYEAEVDLIWCQYYPLRDNWHAPPPPGARELSVGSSVTRKARSAFWRVVERSMRDGTLLDLQKGKLGGVSTMHEEESEDDDVNIQEQESRKASQRYQMELQRLKRISPKKVKAYETVSNKVHRAEVDLNYCKYYPKNRPYQALSEWRDFGKEITNAVPSLTGTPAQLWKLVEDCMSTGSLQELTEGNLDSTRRGPGDLAGKELPLMHDIRAAVPLAGDGPADVSDKVTGVEMPEASKSPVRSMHNPSEKDDMVVVDMGSHNDGTNPTGDEGNTSGKVDHAWTPLTKIVDLPQGDGQESDSHSAAGSSAESSITAELHGPDESGGSSTEDAMDDAMKEYADSERMLLPNLQRQSPSRFQSKREVRILADLSPEDLNAQLRYFYFTKDPKELSHYLPIHCLVCGKTGHMATDCEYLACGICEAYNRHVTANCSASVRCPKCGEQGHKEPNCPYKLQRLSRQEMICDLCKRTGHTEEECELLWRTSGRPWESDMSDQSIRIFCYECGNRGHLGNDCMTRRPGKAMGSSTWSLRREGPTPSNNSEISIRGRAHQRSFPTTITDDDDDRGNFYRRKVPEPAKRGQIHVNISNSRTLESIEPAWTPVNQHKPFDGQRTSQYQNSQLERRDVYHSNRSNYERGRPNSYRANKIQPQAYGKYADYREERYPTPPPQQLGSHYVHRPRPQDTYQSLPSVGRNTW